MKFLRLILALVLVPCLSVGAEALRVADIQHMSRAALEEGQGATVTGLVTFVMSWIPGSVILTDPESPDGPAVYATDAIYGPQTAVGFGDLRAGDILEMTATPKGMQLEPGLYVSDFRLIGHGELHAPALVSVAAIQAGRLNNRRVRVRGVLVSAHVEGEGADAVTFVALGTPDGRITARVRGCHSELDRLRDAEIEIEGVALPVFNPRAEFRYAEIEALEGLPSIAVLHAPPESPFDVAASAGSGVLSWRSTGTNQHAVRIFGEVTYVSPDDGYFILQHDKTAVMVSVESGDLPSLGLRLEVSGFPVMREDTGALVNSVYRELPPSASEVVVPYRLSLSEQSKLEVGGIVNDNDLSYRLVEVRGRVLRVTSLPGLPLRFVMSVDDESVEVAFPFEPGRDYVARLEDGPEIVVRGVLFTRLRRNAVFARYFLFGPFTVLPRSLGDLEIIPDFAWRLNRAARYGAYALLLLAASLLGALAFLLIRRHRDHYRQRVIAADRTRIAGELHDTISQHISGAKLWIFAAKTAAGARIPPPAGDALDMATKVLEATRLEIRNAILDLQSDVFLADTPREVLQRFARGADVPNKIRVRTLLRGLPPALPIGEKRDLLALVQEAFSNAVRHGNAKNVIVVSEGNGKAFTLRVLNDGAPFDPASAPGPETGHFGLSNMRERATRAGLALSFGEYGGYRAVTLERKAT